jgi:hypothetical protein
MLAAYKAEYESTNITIDALKLKYDLTDSDIEGHESWVAYGTQAVEAKVISKPKRITKSQAKTNKVLGQSIIVPATIETIPSLPEEPAQPEEPNTEVCPNLDNQLSKIANFKELALDHCLTFMAKDAKWSEVKEFKDIVAIVDSLEKSYQKVDPDAGKPTINILIQNLVERFQDDC